MRKSGLADSPFFSVPQKEKGAHAPLPQRPRTEKGEENPSKGIEKPKPAKQPPGRDTMTPQSHETVIELIRKAVKEFGKEAATHRFTTAEKKAIADAVYSYKNGGVRTSENEIARIAVNFIINDYRENGENSVLDRALKALNE